MRKPGNRELKILAIGNSFSQDALQHLYPLAAEAGFQDIVIGNLTIGGAPLELHWHHAKNDTAAYSYHKNVDGKWRVTGDFTIMEGLKDEAWHWISLQQSSRLSGIRSTYTDGDHLKRLLSYVQQHHEGERLQLAWHMTWAYQWDSPHIGFQSYDGDQMTMYRSIVQAVTQHIVPCDAFRLIIPVGTAIQNVRRTFIGDTLTRDGHHLNEFLGQYVAGLTWLHSITGCPIDGLRYVPVPSVLTDSHIQAIKKAVQDAITHPFHVAT